MSFKINVLKGGACSRSISKQGFDHIGCLKINWPIIRKEKNEIIKENFDWFRIIRVLQSKNVSLSPGRNRNC